MLFTEKPVSSSVELEQSVSKSWHAEQLDPMGNRAKKFPSSMDDLRKMQESNKTIRIEELGIVLRAHFSSDNSSIVCE
jgi:hypothetical protein